MTIPALRRRPALRAALSAIAAVVCASVGAPAAAQLPPLPAGVRAELAKVEADPPPKQLAANAHFVVSDERAHWTFHGATAGKGGVLVGVGTDPNYVFAGWMKADLVLLVDFDQVVVDVHGVYRLAFREAADPDAFLRLWSAPQQGVLAARIDAVADPAERRRLKAAFRMSRGLVFDKLNYTKRAYAKQGVATFLTDADQYRHLRDLVSQDRVWAWRGDLTAAKTMTGLQAALRASHLEVMVFYLTNAEAYFDYTAQAKRNLGGLPYAAESVVLRTQGVPAKPETSADGHYRYLSMNGRDFAAWLQHKRVTSAKTVCWARKPTKVQGYFTIPGPPAAGAR